MDINHLPPPGHLLLYERVRASRKYEMHDPRAQKATGLSLQEYLAVQVNYGILKEMWPVIIRRVKTEVEAGIIKPRTGRRQIVVPRGWRVHSVDRKD